MKFLLLCSFGKSVTQVVAPCFNFKVNYDKSYVVWESVQTEWRSNIWECRRRTKRDNNKTRYILKQVLFFISYLFVCNFVFELIRSPNFPSIFFICFFTWMFRSRTDNWHVNRLRKNDLKEGEEKNQVHFWTRLICSTLSTEIERGLIRLF